jgi:GNAT superfamily N-acetyltransferase
VVRIDENVSADDEVAVTSGLRAFNEVRLGPPNELPVKLVVRDDTGRVVGGLLGHTKWKWVYVSKLWVADAARGQGWGTKLMERAEALGRSRGCTDIYLDTFEFQARPFYERLGYKLFGTLDGFPPGYCQFFLTKRL